MGPWWCWRVYCRGINSWGGLYISQLRRSMDNEKAHEHFSVKLQGNNGEAELQCNCLFALSCAKGCIIPRCEDMRIYYKACRVANGETCVFPVVNATNPHKPHESATQEEIWWPSHMKPIDYVQSELTSMLILKCQKLEFHIRGRICTWFMDDFLFEGNKRERSSHERTASFSHGCVQLSLKHTLSKHTHSLPGHMLLPTTKTTAFFDNGLFKC